MVVDLEGRSVTARRLLQRLRQPGALEADRAGVALRDALGTATVYDAVRTCAERALAKADPRLRMLVERCDVAGEPMKTVARDFHVSLRHLFRFRAVVFDALGVEMQRVIDSRMVVSRDPAKAEAQRLVTLSKFLLSRMAPFDDVRAIAAAQGALRIDPSSVAAWCSVASANISLALRSAGDSDLAIRQAAIALERAEDLAPESGVVLGLRASHTLWNTRDYAEAERTARLAVESASGSARGHYTLGWVSAMRGEFDEAERQFAAASMAAPDVWTYHVVGMTVLHLRRDFERCAERCRELHDINPDDAFVLGYYTETLNALGRFADTIALNEAAPTVAKNFSTTTAVARAHALLGDVQTAKTMAQAFHGPAVSRAALALTFGNEDEALRALAAAHEEHNGMLDIVAFDPVFDAFRGEPRFLKIIARAS